MTSAIRFGRSSVVRPWCWSFVDALNAERAGGGDQDDGAAAPTKVLTVCAMPASMPRTDKAPDGTPRGLDVAVAERVGRVLGRTVEFHWCASAGCAWNCLPAGRCDVVVGQPHESGPPRDRGLERSLCRCPVRAGGPARSAGHSLAGRPPRQTGRDRDRHGGPRRRRTTRSLASSRAKRCSMGSQAAALDAAFLDADFAAWYLHEHPELELRLVPEYVPRERWNMALAVRAKDAQLLVEINRALAQLAESGELRKIYAEHGVPFRPPFTASTRNRRCARHLAAHPRPAASWSSAWTPPTCPTPAPRASARGSTSSWRGPWPSGLHVKLRIDWLDIQRETAVGRAARAAVRPGLRRGRRGERRRRR